jgi:hypothetical protein
LLRIGRTIIFLKVFYMFRKKNNRVVLSDILLRHDSDTQSGDNLPKDHKTERKVSVSPLASKSISKGFLFIILLICCSAIGAFFLAKENGRSNSRQNQATVSEEKNEDNNYFERATYVNNLKTKVKEHEAIKNKPNNNTAVFVEPGVDKNIATEGLGNSATPEDKGVLKTQYKVSSKAFWYREPSKKARERRYISRNSSAAPFNALAEKNGFVYASISSNKGGDIEGWLRKRDLRPVKVRIYQSDMK